MNNNEKIAFMIRTPIMLQARTGGRPLVDVLAAADDTDVRGRAGDRPRVHAARHRPRTPQRPRQR